MSTHIKNDTFMYIPQLTVDREYPIKYVGHNFT